MFHADRHTDGRTTQQSLQSFFAIVRKGLKISGALGKKWQRITKLHEVTNQKTTATADYKFKYFAFYLTKTSGAYILGLLPALQSLRPGRTIMFKKNILRYQTNHPETSAIFAQQLKNLRNQCRDWPTDLKRGQFG